MNFLDAHRIKSRIDNPNGCMIIYLPIERIEINLNYMIGISDLDPKIKYSLYDSTTDSRVKILDKTNNSNKKAAKTNMK